jgi:hypothetical protein
MVTRDRVDVGAAASAAEMLEFESSDEFENPRGWDDFVPERTCCLLDDSACQKSHDYERDIQRKLMDVPGLHFSSLVVRRLDNGVCIQGVLESSGPHLDVARLVRDLAGVENVLDQVVVRDCPTAVMEC